MPADTTNIRRIAEPPPPESVPDGPGVRENPPSPEIQPGTAQRLTAAQLLAAIVESSDDAIVSKSLQGVIQSWNAGAERIFGYTPDQTIGRHISLIIPPERMSEEEQILRKISNGERVEHFDTVRVRRDGRRIPVSLTISPVKDDLGRIVGASKIARDISDRKRAEEALREADRRKDEFLAILAHELRNPLAPIANALAITKRARDNPELLSEALGTIERQTTHMVRLVDDLIDVSRVTRGNLPLRNEAVALRDVIQPALEAARPLAERFGHHVAVSLPDETLHLFGDSVRLAQIFANLLNNACKYTEPGGSIQLSARAENDSVFISITDTGIGIPADKLDHIFEMFAQVEPGVERAQGGLGIGLTLVKRLVELHGGSICACSAGRGRGSEFTVRLPLAADSRGQSAVGAAALPTRQAALRVLVVDDNHDSGSSLAGLLGLSGHKAFLAYDGAEAIEAANRLRPNVILLDIGLPKMNGYDVCRFIRERDWGSRIKIIALTGWGQAEDRRRSREAGFDGHLVKPVDFDALMALVEGGS